jgi:hypothetical protein
MLVRRSGIKEDAAMRGGISPRSPIANRLKDVAFYL